MTNYSQRSLMPTLTRRMRAYFAPVNRSSATPTLFDPAHLPQFPLDAPPFPWISAGWIENFSRKAESKILPITAGAKGAPLYQYRSHLAATVTCDFCEWGKLQLALSAGCQQMNLLAENPNATGAASGGTPATATAVLTGSSVSEVIVGAGAVNSFAAGNLVAVDSDYAQQTGFVGTGIPGAYVKAATDVRQDANYIRRITFNVARVASMTANSLLLANPLPGGAPSAGMGVQQIVGFIDREGGSFFQEWSALFVAASEHGGCVYFYYPRLQPATSAAEHASPI